MPTFAKLRSHWAVIASCFRHNRSRASSSSPSTFKNSRSMHSLSLLTAIGGTTNESRFLGVRPRSDQMNPFFWQQPRSFGGSVVRCRRGSRREGDLGCTRVVPVMRTSLAKFSRHLRRKLSRSSLLLIARRRKSCLARRSSSFLQVWTKRSCSAQGNG